MKTNKTAVLILLFAIIGCSKQKVGGSIPEDAFSVRMPEVTQEVDRVIIDANQKPCLTALNSLGFNTLHKVYNGKASVISPLSLYLALGMLANGTEGESLEELLAVLGAKDNIMLRDFCHSLLLQMPAVDMNAKLKLANTVVVDDNYPLKSAYRKSMADYYYSPVENLPFSNSDLVLNLVNGWCNDATEGLIPKVIERLDKGVFMFIMNALCIKAAWSAPFADSQVRKRPFNGGEQLDFLCEQAELKYLETESFRMVRRPFSAGKYVFDIILPNENYTISDILSLLSKGEWAGYSNIMKGQLVKLQFPVIDIDEQYNLLDVLKNLGVCKVFGKEADLSPMFESGALQPGKVIQKSKVTVDKNGVEAAAVTAITMESSAGAPGSDYVEFDANRPFVYTISEISSGAILFAGVFSN